MSVGIYKLSARDVMTRGADTIRDTDSIHSAIEQMVNLALSALPVVNQQNKCVGVLTKTDIIKLTGALDVEITHPARSDLAALYFGLGIDDITESKVEDVMTTHVVSVHLDDSLKDVASKMLRHEIHHVPVCDADQEVLGMVSSMDLVRAI